MKKYVLLILVVVAILTSGIATAQNANRSGFFLEAGIGGLIGNTPRSSISIEDNIMYYKCISGAAMDFGFGGRFRIKSHWAYELKFEAQFPISSPYNNMIGRCLPVSFRYTSLEIYKNYSLYTHVSLGAAIVANSGIITWNIDNPTLYPNTPAIEFKGFLEGVGLGPAYSLGLGVNMTTHVYAEANWNGQTIFGAYGKNGNEVINYGSIGFVVGYRF